MRWLLRRVLPAAAGGVAAGDPDGGCCVAGDAGADAASDGGDGLEGVACGADGSGFAVTVAGAGSGKTGDAASGAVAGTAAAAGGVPVDAATVTGGREALPLQKPVGSTAPPTVTLVFAGSTNSLTPAWDLAAGSQL